MTRINMLTNPSFEVDAAGWTGATRATTTAAYKLVGDAYATVTSAATSDKTAATAGLDYSASAWCTRTTFARTAAVTVHFFDATGAELSPPTVTQTAVPQQPYHSHFRSTRTAPAGTTQVSMRLTVSGTAFFDAALLEQSSTIGTYFDGTTANDFGSHAWTGAPHASTSTETPGLARPNSLINPSFESGTMFGWNGVVAGGSTAIDTTTGFVGSHSLLFTASTSNTLVSGTNGSGQTAEMSPLIPGLTYTLSAYVLLSVSRNVQIQPMGADASGVPTAGYAPAQVASVPAGTWTMVSRTFVARAGDAFLYPEVKLVNAAVTNTMHIDGVLLELATAPGEYFDGSTTADGFTYAWTGAVGESTSTETVGSGPVTISSAFTGAGTLTAALTGYRRISSGFSGTGVLDTAWKDYRNLYSDFAGAGVLTTKMHRRINSALSGSGVLSTSVTTQKIINSSFTGAGVLATHLARAIRSSYVGSGSLATALTGFRWINPDFSGYGTLTTSISGGTPPTPPAPAVSSSALGRLASFSVNTAAVGANPAEGSGSTPSVSASYIKGTDPEYALGETNVLKNGAIGTYEGEIVSVTTSVASATARVSMDTLLTPLNVDMHLFPFIDGVPGLWTAARALEYWTQQCGVFYDKVPGDCVAYASGFGHTDSFGASTTARFYERLTGGATTTQVVNGRSVKTLGSAVTGTTAFHELPKGAVAVSLPKSRKLVFSTGLGLLGTGRTATVRWNFLDSKDAAHMVSLEATSAGAVTAKIGTVTIASASVPAGATYRLALSLERLSATTLTVKLTAHTDDLTGAGTLVHDGAASTATYALPGVMRLTSLEHVSAGGSGAQMTRWGAYLTVVESHPMELPAVQKVLGETKKPFGFVSGFEGNVWNLLNEFCSIAKLDVRFLDGALHVSKRTTAISLPGVSWSQFEVTAQRREKYKQVAVVNKQSKAVATDDAVLWRADSVFSVAAREVFETTVQTPHSILNVVQPVAVDGILPFPYIQGAGQYVVTGADGYIVAPAWWNDNGGLVEVSLTGKEGELAIKITAPTQDTVRAPYRISEGAADRPALYVCGSGILNDPKEVHINSGAKNAREGFDSVFESPFIAGVRETYDTAAAMAHEYSASVAEVQYSLPNDFETPTGLGQYPAGTLVTDNKRNFRIMDASQTHSKVSGNAVPHTTIGAYVASYPEGATIRDEKARHAGRTIRKFNIKPLKGDA